MDPNLPQQQNNVNPDEQEPIDPAPAKAKMNKPFWKNLAPFAFVIVFAATGSYMLLQSFATKTNNASLSNPQTFKSLDTKEKITASSLQAADYNLVWEDQFNGSELDKTRWNIKDEQGSNVDIRYSPDAISLKDGEVSLTTFTENGTHKSGWISTENKFQAQYGYIEARIDFSIPEKIDGMGFWLFHPLVNTYGDPWNHGIEIDIVEKTKNNFIGSEQADVSEKALLGTNWGEYGADWDNHPSRSSGWVGSGLASGFHTYSVEWTPTYIKYYIDGQYMWQVNDSGGSPVSRRDEFLIFSHHPAGGSTDYGSKSTSVAKMKVDYVKVYQTPPKIPPKPTNITRTGGSGSTTINWELSANATGYNVKRAVQGSNIYTTVGSTISELTFSDQTADPSKSYLYAVTSKNVVGESGKSNPVTVKPNLAKSKPTVASPNARQTAINATDGNNGSMWESTWATDPQWIYVDLQQSKSINTVLLNWTEAYGKSYNIDISMDAVNWTTVYSTTSGDGGIDEISFPSRTARYVRMIGLSRANRWVNPSPFGYALYEFEVYASAPAPTPTKLTGYTNNNSVKLSWNASVGVTSYKVKRSTTQSGPYTTVATGLKSTDYTDKNLTNGTTYFHVVTAVNGSGESSSSNETRTIPRANIAIWQKSYNSAKLNTDTQPFKAFDGMMDKFDGVSTTWFSPFTDTQWIYVDLQTIYPVNRVVLNWDYGYGKAFDIQTSTDAVNWTNVYSTESGTGGVSNITFAPTNARYVRMNGRQQATAYGYSLKEFEVYAQ